MKRLEVLARQPPHVLVEALTAAVAAPLEAFNKQCEEKLSFERAARSLANRDRYDHARTA